MADRLAVTPLDLVLVAVTLRPSQRHEAAAGFAGLGLAAPEGPRLTRGAGLAAFAAGPERWIVIATDSDGWSLERRLATALGGAALVNDQSDARAAYSLEGPAVLSLLEKGVSIDLHPAVFPPDSAAVTEIAGIGAWLWKEAPQRFVAVVPRSYAASFEAWLSGATAGL